MCMCVTMCMGMHMWAQPSREGRGVRSLELELQVSVSPWHGCWKIELGSPIDAVCTPNRWAISPAPGSIFLSPVSEPDWGTGVLHLRPYPSPGRHHGMVFRGSWMSVRTMSTVNGLIPEQMITLERADVDSDPGLYMLSGRGPGLL